MKVLLAVAFALAASRAEAAEIEGPARFCGYSPIIDLLPGEKVITLGGGFHGGTFIWEGEFGSFEVGATGWGIRPKGRIVSEQPGNGLFRFAQRKRDGLFIITIWNGSHGVATFSSETRMTESQIAAIERVGLFDEGEAPTDCDLRTTFSFDALVESKESHTD